MREEQGDISYVIIGKEAGKEHYLIAVKDCRDGVLVAQEGHPTIPHGCIQFFEDDILGMPMVKRRRGPSRIPVKGHRTVEIYGAESMMDQIGEEAEPGSLEADIQNYVKANLPNC